MSQPKRTYILELIDDDEIVARHVKYWIKCKNDQHHCVSNSEFQLNFIMKSAHSSLT